MHGTACLQRLLLEPHHEIEHRARSRSTIEQIAEAHEVCRAAGPRQIRIDDVHGAEQTNEFIVSAMDVADGDDPFDVRPTPL